MQLNAQPNGYIESFNGKLRYELLNVEIFYTLSNDGSQLFVNDQLVVDNDGHHGAIEKNGTIHLTPGLHPFKVTYFQMGNASMLRALYEGPSIDKQTIPAPVLYR